MLTVSRVWFLSRWHELFVTRFVFVCWIFRFLFLFHCSSFILSFRRKQKSLKFNCTAKQQQKLLAILSVLSLCSAFRVNKKRRKPKTVYRVYSSKWIQSEQSTICLLFLFYFFFCSSDDCFVHESFRLNGRAIFFIYISFGATFSVVIRGRTRAQAHATFAMEQRKNNMFRQMHFLFRSDSSCRNVVSVDVELNVVLFVFFFKYFFLRFSRFKWNLLKSINGMWEHSLLSLLCISLLSSLDATEAFIAIETYACCGVQTISTYWIA